MPKVKTTRPHRIRESVSGAATQNSKFFDRVYELVKGIPEGKVATYGQIARVLGTRDARVVGFALYANSDPKVPCHRVVNKDGRLAPNFAFGGYKEQRRRLLAEGIKFKDERHVDLKSCLWQFDLKTEKLFSFFRFSVF